MVVPVWLAEHRRAAGMMSATARTRLEMRASGMRHDLGHWWW
jgi:hypothetical protein